MGEFGVEIILIRCSISDDSYHIVLKVLVIAFGTADLSLQMEILLLLIFPPVKTAASSLNDEEINKKGYYTEKTDYQLQCFGTYLKTMENSLFQILQVMVEGICRRGFTPVKGIPGKFLSRYGQNSLQTVTRQMDAIFLIYLMVFSALQTALSIFELKNPSW